MGGASSIPVEVDIGTSDQKIIQDHLNVQALIRAYQVWTITIGMCMSVTVFVNTCSCTCIKTCSHMYMNKLKWRVFLIVILCLVHASLFYDCFGPLICVSVITASFFSKTSLLISQMKSNHSYDIF